MLDELKTPTNIYERYNVRRCPKCNGLPVFYGDTDNNGVLSVHATCGRCGESATGFYPSIRSAAMDWNGETPPSDEEPTVIKMKPCPFCGGIGSLSLASYQYLDIHFSVNCGHCGIFSLSFNTLDEALNAWDRRVSGKGEIEAMLPELRDTLKEILQEIPIIVGDSRHDALVEALWKAQELVDSLECE